MLLHVCSVTSVSIPQMMLFIDRFMQASYFRLHDVTYVTLPTP